MAVTDRPVLRSDAAPDEKLGSAAIPVLCGFAYLFVGLAFSYLDRHIGRFGFESVWWAIWALLGFGIGALNLNADPARSRTEAKAFPIIAGVLAVFPGFLMFTLVRWAAFSLLLISAARASNMRSRRDLYYCLASIVAISLLVATHSNADWTTWIFYLGPAWLFIALTLAWDYAAGVQLSSLRKSGLTLGFVAVCIAVSSAIFAVAPQPNILGFGFLPPGTDVPGRVRLEADAQGGGRLGRGDPQSAARTDESVLGQALSRMRKSLKEPSLPQWERSAISGLLAAGESILRALGSADGRAMVRSMTPAEAAAFAARAAAVVAVLRTLAMLLFLLLLALVGWRLRWRLGIAAALWSAWALARWRPSASMSCSAYAVRWMLRREGYPMLPGQSVTEHIESAAALPAPARRWLGASVRLYCEQRFGGVRGSPQGAGYMRRAIEATRELLRSPIPKPEQR